MDVIASVNTPVATEAAIYITELPPGVDAVEVRLDALWPDVPGAFEASDDLERIIAAGVHQKIPLIATLRPKRQGGAFAGDEAIRLNLLAAAAKAGFSWVDLENDNRDMRAVLAVLREAGAKVILSQHDFVKAPSTQDGMRQLLAMQDLGGDLHKFAFTCASFLDVLRVMELAKGHRARGGTPCVLPMGHGGAAARALLPLAGNGAVYGAAAQDEPAAPGQPTLEELAAIWRHWDLRPAEVDPAAPWYAVLGTPIGHSLSPRIFNGALREAGRTERYGAIEVPASPGSLRLLAHVAGRIGLAGASVTAPHKVDALALATGDDVATAVGAANCLRFRPEGAEATNTDATALQRLLADAPGDDALVIGAGGAARAALVALGRLGKDTTVATRSETGRTVADSFGASWQPIGEASPATIVIQATPVGSTPGDASPIAAAIATEADTVVEMVYAQGATAFQQAAADGGATVIDGRRFLIEQAVEQYAYWFNQPAPRAAMLQSIQEAAP